ncbi:MAG: hypothetical protein AMJ75_01965 [Phycisphaerae bacterium SM1_79]|nr:MAG: hypothetical protein AMJ75_01965 [Phycisphaerae bacterium SM1_79]
MKRTCLIILILLLVLTSLAVVLRFDPRSLVCRPKMWGMPLLADIALIDDPEFIVVPVTINSKRYRFFVDTCTVNSCVDIRLKPLLGDFVRTSKNVPNLSNANLDIDYYKLPENFRLGFLKPYGVIGCYDFSVIGDLTAYDGIIGMNLLNDNLLQLDIENKRMRLVRKPSSAEADSQEDPNYKKELGYPIPLIRDERDWPYIHIRLSDTINELFMVDTGLRGHNYLRRESFDKLRAKEGTEYERVQDGKEQIEAIRIAEARLANIKVSPMVFIANPQSVLGTKFLKYFKMVTFDFRDDKLYLKPMIDTPSHNAARESGKSTGTKVHKSGYSSAIHE